MNKILYLSLLIFSSQAQTPQQNPCYPIPQPFCVAIIGPKQEQKKPFPLRIKKFIQSIGDFCQRFPASCTMMLAPTK